MSFLKDMLRGKEDAERDKKKLPTEYIPNENNWCKDADRMIKELDVRIAQMAKDKIGKDYRKKIYAGIMISPLESKRSKLKIDFINKECTFKLEQEKAKETAKIIGEEVEKYEDDVLESSDDERKKLFIIGGVVLLVALGIITYSLKKK